MNQTRYRIPHLLASRPARLQLVQWLFEGRATPPASRVRIAMIGGTGPQGEWRITVANAIRMLDDSRGIYIKRGGSQRRVRTARSRTGRRYLRTSGRGAGSLEDLPGLAP